MKTAAEMIKYYKSTGLPSHWMKTLKDQYVSMANGGSGGILHGIHVTEDGDVPIMISCREYNYPFKKDAFFQEVCDAMGWDWRDSQ